MKRLCLKIGLMLASAALALSVAEIVARNFLPNWQSAFVLRPFIHKKFTPHPKSMPGITGISHFRVNSIGMRGEEMPEQVDQRILTIGGSTTACMFLDQEEAWPHIMQKRMTSATHRVWVGNMSKSGMGSREHTIQYQRLLPEFSNVDTVISLIGYNDLSMRLIQDQQYNPNGMDDPKIRSHVTSRAFVVQGVSKDDPFFKKSSLWWMMKRLRWSLRQSENRADVVIDDAGRIYDDWRRYRREKAPYRNVLPDLASALGEYERNLKMMIQIAKQQQVRLILVTQPVLWRQGLSKKAQAMIWGGAIKQFPNGESYYSITTLRKAMDQYNEKLLAVCSEEQVECVDAASKISGNEALFYDDCHLNEAGAAEFADLIVRYLKEASDPDDIESLTDFLKECVDEGGDRSCREDDQRADAK